jgi:hypothetical protein
MSADRKEVGSFNDEKKTYLKLRQQLYTAVLWHGGARRWMTGGRRFETLSRNVGHQLLGDDALHPTRTETSTLQPRKPKYSYNAGTINLDYFFKYFINLHLCIIL